MTTPVTTSTPDRQTIRQLQDGDSVATSFLIKYSAIQTGKTGKPYMNLIFMDRTGEIEARVWDLVPQYTNLAVRDAFVEVIGRCKYFQGRPQITVKTIKLLREDEVNPADFIADSPVDPEALYGQLLRFIESMEDPHYRALAESILIEDEDVVSRLKIAPAAKSVHHAYRSGLLDHIISVVGLLDKVSQHYGSMVNRDLLLLGGFFHDIAKIWELSYERVTDYTDEGRLVGHLVMGFELISKKIDELNAIPGKLPTPFTTEKALLVKHVILAHHGELEYGSPKRPKVLEAHIVHEIDDLDSKIQSISTIIRQDQTPGRWTSLSRQYERYFYKTPWLTQPPPSEY